MSNSDTGSNFLLKNKSLLTKVLKDATYMNNLKGMWLSASSISSHQGFYMEIMNIYQRSVLDGLCAKMHTQYDPLESISDQKCIIELSVWFQNNYAITTQCSSSSGYSHVDKCKYESDFDRIKECLIINKYQKPKTAHTVIKIDVHFEKDALYMYDIRVNCLYNIRNESRILTSTSYTDKLYRHMSGLVKEMSEDTSYSEKDIIQVKMSVMKKIIDVSRIELCDCCMNVITTSDAICTRSLCKHKFCWECTYLLQVTAGKCIICNQNLKMASQSIAALHERMHITMLNYHIDYDIAEFKPNGRLTKGFIMKELIINKINLSILSNKISRGLSYTKRVFKIKSSFKTLNGYDIRDDKLGELIVIRYLKSNLITPVSKEIGTRDWEKHICRELECVMRSDAFIANKVSDNHKIMIREGMFSCLKLWRRANNLDTTLSVDTIKGYKSS